MGSFQMLRDFIHIKHYARDGALSKVLLAERRNIRGFHRKCENSFANGTMAGTVIYLRPNEYRFFLDFVKEGSYG